MWLARGRISQTDRVRGRDRKRNAHTAILLLYEHLFKSDTRAVARNDAASRPNDVINIRARPLIYVTYAAHLHNSACYCGGPCVYVICATVTMARVFDAYMSIGIYTRFSFLGLPRESFIHFLIASFFANFVREFG